MTNKKTLNISSPPPDPYVKTDEPLLWLGGAGRESRDENYFFDTRHRDDRSHIVMQLTLSGCGFYKRGPTEELLTPNRAFFDRIPNTFRYGHARRPDAQHGEKYELVFVSMYGPVAQRWMRRLHRSFGPVLSFGTDSSIGELMQGIAKRHEHGVRRLDRYLVSAQLYALLMQTWSVLSRSKLKMEPRVERAIEVIDRRAGDASLTVQTLAESLECSRAHLTRTFHRATGQTPLEYVTQKRLRLAAWALRRSDDKIDVIARRCGFGSANYLCRVFRQRWKITPAQYRQSGVELLLE